MSQNPHIVDAQTLRQLSGKQSRSGVCKWASERGIRVIDGDKGPFTTLEALNKALGVLSANDESYVPDQVL